MSRTHQIRPNHGSKLAPAKRLRSALSVAALCAVSGFAWAAPAATALLSTGDVRVLSAKGEVRELKTGAVVESGETVQTGKGRVQLRMIDGAMMALGERTVLRLDDYRLAGPAGNDERGFMSLVSGALRTISGSIGHPRADHYKLDTPSGTIGIRGTEYTVDLANGLRVGVIGGGVAVCNDGGCVDVAKGFSAYTPSRSVKPGISPQQLVHLQPANAKNAGPGGAPPPAPPPQTNSGSAPGSTAPSAGDKISRYLVDAFKAPAVARLPDPHSWRWPAGGAPTVAG
jgi:hypothetical protein